MVNYTEAFLNASIAINQTGRLTAATLANTPMAMDALKELYAKKKKYKSVEVPLDEVEFYMVGNNYTNVQKRLDEIREVR